MHFFVLPEKSGGFDQLQRPLGEFQLQPLQFFPGILQAQVGVGVHGDADLGMAHEILQCLGIHAALGLVGAVGMAAHMGRDVGQLVLVGLVVLLHDALKVFLPVHGHRGTVILVIEQKASVAVDGGLNIRRLPARQDPLEAGVNIVLHGEDPGACVGLGGGDVLGAVASALKLMVDADGFGLHVQIADSQATKLGDPQACVEQDVDAIIVFAEALVLQSKSQEFSHLLPADGIPGDGIVDQDLRHLEVKGILAENVILHRRCKGRPQHTADGVNGAVAPLVLLLQLDEEQLGIGGADLLDGLMGKASLVRMFTTVL